MLSILQAMEDLIAAYSMARPLSDEQMRALESMSGMLELAQKQYERLVGDIYAGAHLRNRYKVARLASLILTHKLLEEVAETYVLDSIVSSSSCKILLNRCAHCKGRHSKLVTYARDSLPSPLIRHESWIMTQHLWTIFCQNAT